MPQAPSDLRPQFNFLYPHEHIINDDELVNKFNPVYVRTTKKDLGLMKPIYNIHKLHQTLPLSYFMMNILQKDLLQAQHWKIYFQSKVLKRRF